MDKARNIEELVRGIADVIGMGCCMGDGLKRFLC